MRLLLSVICILGVLHCSYAPPVTANKSKEHEDQGEEKEHLIDKDYYRYLREVVEALESDPDFREKLEKANEDDVRSGRIAEHLDFVNHNVRTHLDEIKRREMERLRHLATMQYELTNHLNMDKEKEVNNEHLDHHNPHTFEIEDLKKLIKKTSADLEEADNKRREQFKEYEMQKEFDKHQKLEQMDDTQKKEYEHKIEEEEKAKKKHEPLHHPITKEQLVELWKKADELEERDFSPRTFFMMHDVDGNGVWDANEVKALFISELDKMYGPNGPNKDLHERAEEMERMREHVFKESDLNRDGLIDFNEFIQQTKRSDFQQDQGWQPLDENQIYTQAEYQEYERRKHDEVTYLQQRGLVDAYGNPVPGAHQQIRQALNERRQYYQQQQAYHHQQMQGQPQYHHGGQVPPIHGQVPQGQVPPVHGQVPPVQGQVPPVQGHVPPVHGQAQPVQGQVQPNQDNVPPHNAQVPPVHGQVPQGQVPPVQAQHAQGQVSSVQGQVPQAQGQQPPVQGQVQQEQGHASPVQNQPPQAQGQVPPVQGHEGPKYPNLL